MAADTNNICREARVEEGEAFPHQQSEPSAAAKFNAAPDAPSPPEGSPASRCAPRCGAADVPERGVSRVDLQGAGGPGAGSALPDELARAGVVDPDVGAGLGLGVHGCRVEQGSWQCTLPVGKGCGTVLPVGENRP